MPSEITSSEELDDLFNAFGSAGIEVLDSDKAFREDGKPFDRTAEGAEELELDLTPGALDKTNDPVRMYLREMGTVPLLTREGEVAIAKRIERGKLSVIKSISRTPMVTKKVLQLGEDLKNDQRTIRELVTFSDEELTDDKIEDRKREVPKQIEAVKKARVLVQKAEAEAGDVPKKDKREAEPPRRWEFSRRAVSCRSADSRDRIAPSAGEAPDDRGDQGGRSTVVQRTEREIAHVERQLVAAEGPQAAEAARKTRNCFRGASRT